MIKNPHNSNDSSMVFKMLLLPSRLSFSFILVYDLRRGLYENKVHSLKMISLIKVFRLKRKTLMKYLIGHNNHVIFLLVNGIQAQ